VGVHVTQLAETLAGKGHHVHVFTRRGPGQAGHEVLDGVHYHRCTYPAQMDFVDDVNSMCGSFVDRVFEVEDLLGRFDIIHAHDWLAANAMIWIKQGRGHKCLLTIHSTEYGRCGNVFAMGRSERIRIQERAGTYWADRVIAVSGATQKEVSWMYEVPNGKISVIYNAVDPRRFDQTADPGEDKRRYHIAPLDPTILFCGRLVWQKGPDLLVEAIPRILKLHPSAKVVFVGEGDMRGTVESRVRQLGVAHAVRFLGYRTGDELVRLFKLADAVCVPSRNEPFGIVVLEAWSACKPVVVTQNGGPNEYVGHDVNGLKIDPSADSVVWGVNRILSDFDRARWMGQNGRKAVEERFVWDLVADQTLALYRELCPSPTVLPDTEASSVPTLLDAPFAETPRAAVPDGDLVEIVSEEEKDGSPVYMQAKLRFRTTDLAIGVPNPLAGCRVSLARSGLNPQCLDHSLTIKGDMETVLAALNRCHKRMKQTGVWNQNQPRDEDGGAALREVVRSGPLGLAGGWEGLRWGFPQDRCERTNV
jgi:glycosyltransferase involved in cell wall biosynthesis